jgi:hypothetical protein
VENIGENTVPHRFIFDILHLRGGQIAQQDVSTPRWLVSNLFRDISESHVNRIHGFVPEYHELSFIRQNDDWNYCSTWMVFLNCSLQDVNGLS